MQERFVLVRICVRIGCGLETARTLAMSVVRSHVWGSDKRVQRIGMSDATGFIARYDYETLRGDGGDACTAVAAQISVHSVYVDRVVVWLILLVVLFSLSKDTSSRE